MSAFPFARVFRVLVPVVFLGLCAARNLPWRLADYDQAKQAFTSLEMTGGGNPWFQHTPNGRLATKPPLVGWVSAGLHALPGMDWEWAWRLPSMLATAALGVLLWRAGGTLWPAGGAWLTLGAFGLNLLTPRLATLARTDMVLALWTTVAGLLVWHRRRVGGAWTAGERWTLCGVLTAAMLTKGPIVYAFLLPGLAALECGSLLPLCPAPLTDGADKAGASSRTPKWPWLLPLVVFALWVAAGWLTVPGFYEQVVGREFLGRFDYTERAVHVRQPVWFYVAGLLGRMAPWSLLLLATAWLARPAWRAVGRDPAGRWLIAWTVGGLLLMSLVPSKRLDRIFPVVPPLCLLLTAVVSRARETTSRGERLETLAGWTTAAALAVSLTATGYETRKSFHRKEAALDQFGRRARQFAAARGWPPPELVVGAKTTESDENLLVSLRRLHWLDPVTAARTWHAGQTPLLVLPAATAVEWQSLLGDPAATAPENYAAWDSVTVPRGNGAKYVLVARVNWVPVTIPAPPAAPATPSATGPRAP